MRICRFTTGEEPRFGVVTGEVDEFGQPAAVSYTHLTLPTNREV